VTKIGDQFPLMRRARAEYRIEGEPESRLPRSVPWEFMAPHEYQALTNHSQSLEVLADRGGLDVTEALAVITGRRWMPMPIEQAVTEFLTLFETWMQTPSRIAAARDDRQRRVLTWVRETFGENTTAANERASRFLEEAIELAQAQGLTSDAVLALVQHVYSKPPGNPEQEAGGVGVSLLGYCAAAGFSADSAELAELNRILAIDPNHFRKRHNAKADAGVATRGLEPEKEKNSDG
jgi:hypothetical protein